MQTCSIKLNYSSNQVGVLLYKSNSRTNHNCHCIIGYLMGIIGYLMVVLFYFILHYYLSFRKEICLFECLYFSECDIRMSLYVFWLTKGPSTKYIHNCWDNGGYPKCVHGEVLSRLMCAYGLTLSLFMFLAAFLSYSVFFYSQKFNLYAKKMCCQKRLFISNEINFCCHEISFFHLKLFLLSKLAMISFSVISYFEKTLCSVTQEIRFI